MRPRHEELIILIASTILLSASLFPPSAAAAFRDSLNTSRPLYDGETLVSAGGTFALGFISLNSSFDRRYVAVRYHNIPTHDIVWVANGRNPVHGFTCSLTLSLNGTLLVVDRRNSSSIIWSSPSTSNTIAAVTNPVAQLLDSGNLVIRDNPVAQLLDSGNLVIRDAAAGSNYIWQSFDYPSNTMLAGMFIGHDLRTGLNHNLTSWTSDTDPSPGDYTFEILLRGVPQLVTDGPDQSVYFRAGPWMGDGFTGVQDTTKFKQAFNFTFVSTSERVGYYFEPVGDIVSRLTVHPNGSTERFVWIDSLGKWNEFWKTPRGPCDVMSACGPFGTCNANESPSCRCLWGFRPKNLAGWKLRDMTDMTDGCVRNTTLDCNRNGTSTDGFVTVSGMKLPDTTAAVADRSIGLDECSARCLRNCSCTGYSLANVTGGGSGCIMWTGELTDMQLYTNGGQELYVRLAAADVVKSHADHKGRTAAVVVVPIVGGSITLLIILSSYLRFHHSKRKKMTRRFPGENEKTASESAIDLPLFDFETIAEATNNFSHENKLGEGGFGPVYKGSKDGKEIAVKRLSKVSTQGVDEFKNEVMLIAKFQHRNLVLLLGCCIQRQERILIYEYMSNKSLDTFLFDKEKKGLLNWQLRYGIILGIARGLLYLHQDSALRVVHRDLKVSNILLNREMVPKISDFGLARIFGADEAKFITERVVGTYGYMSPEYLMKGIFSVKSDVFSFGVLVLEIISGKRIRETFSTQCTYNLLKQAWSLWKEGQPLELVDESVDSSFSISEVLKCIKVGLLCVQEHPEDRPLMASVILMLTSDKEVLPEPKCPGFVSRSHSSETDQSSNKQETLLSVNDLTLTMPHGR